MRAGEVKKKKDAGSDKEFFFKKSSGRYSAEVGDMRRGTEDVRLRDEGKRF